MELIERNIKMKKEQKKQSEVHWEYFIKPSAAGKKNMNSRRHVRRGVKSSTHQEHVNWEHFVKPVGPLKQIS